MQDTYKQTSMSSDGAHDMCLFHTHIPLKFTHSAPSTSYVNLLLFHQLTTNKITILRNYFYTSHSILAEIKFRDIFCGMSHRRNTNSDRPVESSSFILPAEPVIYL
jgi:hypothetical protein